MNRQAQTSDYWLAYAFTPDDAEFLYGYLLEESEPKRTNELALAVIRHRIDLENAALRRQLSSDKFYQPKRQYQAGEQLFFPALQVAGQDAGQIASGQVVSVRQGTNPDIGDFEVICVEMADGKRREFAANYHYLHRLNDQDPSTLMDSTPKKTPEELYELYGEHVSIVLNDALAENPEFIRIADEWFLRAMMAEVNIGHLNLAEAVLDMANGGPLTTDVILRDLGLPPDMASNVQEASLNAALASDNRFDEVSLNEFPAWFLRRLEPAEVRQLPAPLHAAHFPNHTIIDESLVALAKELDDELELRSEEGVDVETKPRATLIQTFPHRRAGTLGWTRAAAGVLPKSLKPRFPMRFKDRITGKEMTVWLVHDGRYIFGLADWYRVNDLPAGVYIELSKTDAENVVRIDYRRRKPKREWVRVASVRDGRLHLETAQRAVACEVDELMSVFVDDPRTLDVLRGDRPRDVAQAVREAFPEIAKLSPQGNVHARTLYAVVNVITRAAPTDVFEALTASGTYTPVGDNYWHIGER